MNKSLIVFLMMIVSSGLQLGTAQEKAMIEQKPSQEAIFAMGCFWCGAAAFANHETNVLIEGILEVKAGYTGGKSINPTYSSHEGHQEAVKVVFDPKKITYGQLLDIFWHNVDPFDATGQFCDKGAPYTASIFFKDEAQRKQALESKHLIEGVLKGAITTEIKPATLFYDAEEYHQDYKKKNPVRYKLYRWNCGRDKRLSEIWK